MNRSTNFGVVKLFEKNSFVRKNEPIKSMYLTLNLFSMLGWVLLLKLLVG